MTQQITVMADNAGAQTPLNKHRKKAETLVETVTKDENAVIHDLAGRCQAEVMTPIDTLTKAVQSPVITAQACQPKAKALVNTITIAETDASMKTGMISRKTSCQAANT